MSFPRYVTNVADPWWTKQAAGIGVTSSLLLSTPSGPAIYQYATVFHLSLFYRGIWLRLGENGEWRCWPSAAIGDQGTLLCSVSFIFSMFGLFKWRYIEGDSTQPATDERGTSWRCSLITGSQIDYWNQVIHFPRQSSVSSSPDEEPLDHPLDTQRTKFNRRKNSKKLSLKLSNESVWTTCACIPSVAQFAWLYVVFETVYLT